MPSSGRNIKPSQGQILISDPVLQDFFFRQSVVLLAEHNEEGSFGLIVNKPVDVTLNEVTRDFPPFDAPLYLGGPVKTDSIFFIHTLGDVVQGSLKIMNGLYWGGDIQVIKEMMILNQLTTNDIRFFVGYAGWSSHQLERELKENSWVVSKITAETIIRSNPRKMWGNLIRKFGDDYAIWANYPLDPSMN